MESFAGLTVETIISFGGLVLFVGYAWLEARKDYKSEIEYNRKRDAEFSALLVKQAETNAAQVRVNEDTQKLLTVMQKNCPVMHNELDN